MTETVDRPPAAMTDGPYAVVINRHAGTVRKLGIERLERAFRDALGERLSGVYQGSGRHMARNINLALEEGAKVILPIGGDGSCTMAADMARQKGFLSSALPGGTKNILARRLWGAIDLLDIARMIGARRTTIRQMDAGEANGRLFFVGASFGMIPHLARARERLRGRAQPSGLWAALRHVLRLGRRGLFSRSIQFTVPGHDRQRCSALMVSVHAIDEMLFRPASKPDPASFDCAAASPVGWRHLIWLALKAVFTDVWRRDQKIHDFVAPSLTVEGRSRTVVALDGEAITLRKPVELVMLQDAIPLLGAARDITV